MWIIEVHESRTYKVIFDKDVTENEAEELFSREEYADILDEYPNEILEVIEIR